MSKIMKAFALAAAAAIVAWPMAARAADDVDQMKKEIRALEKKVDALEKTPSTVNVLAISIPEGVASEIAQRDAINDQQEAAARVDNQALDPKYKGFIPVPNTEVIMKFNAKPHVDITYDGDAGGDRYRFVTARIPVGENVQSEGGDGQFNVNANASQLRWDVRAPNVPGNPRFYFQNDFFGDGKADMKYRLQHLYGSIYNVVAGFTYGAFEDPDIWPDTVDYEGPNSVNFVRRPVAHYKHAIGDGLNATFGVEKPDIYLDTVGTDATLDTPMPDLAANLRWENADLGHMQVSAIARSIGFNSDTNGSDSTAGWGFNAGGTYNITPNNTLLALVNVGEGIGGMGNDTSFENTDAAINPDGSIEALPYWSGMVGLTHKWNDAWRSTVTYGYVELDNADGQTGDAYHTTTYASANIIKQVRERLSVGLEALYGEKETKDGSDGDLWRVQLGLVYSIF